MRQKGQVSNTVAQRRKTAGITQEELAEAVSVSRQTIISIEKGNYIPSVMLAMKIAAYFACTVEDIFTIE